jgi:hypothetical protein
MQCVNHFADLAEDWESQLVIGRREGGVGSGWMKPGKAPLPLSFTLQQTPSHLFILATAGVSSWPSSYSSAASLILSVLAPRIALLHGTPL